MRIIQRIAWRLRRWLFAQPVAPADYQQVHRGESGPVVVAGFFRTASGIGESARRCANSLEARGISVIRVDISAVFDQVDFEPDRPLGEMPDTQEGVVILHANAPETERALFELGLWRGRRWRIIGCWVWELPAPPPGWARAARYLSEVWTPSAFVADAFRSALSIPVRTVPYFVPVSSAEPDRAVFGLPTDGLICLTAADGRSSFARKNPMGAVIAFQKAFPQAAEARLVVKTRNLSLFPEFERALRAAADVDPRIVILDAALSADAMATLFATADIFISLHRAEGFGLPIAEAMAAGRAAIATNWSGAVEFIDEETAVPVAYKLAPVDDPYDVYATYSAQWAEPDIDAAASALRRLGDDPALRARIGAAARNAVRTKLDGGGYAAALRG